MFKEICMVYPPDMESDVRDSGSPGLDGGALSSSMSGGRLSGWGSKNRNSKKQTGKWKHGPRPAVCPSCLILSHTHLFSQARYETPSAPPVASSSPRRRACAAAGGPTWHGAIRLKPAPFVLRGIGLWEPCVGPQSKPGLGRSEAPQPCLVLSAWSGSHSSHFWVPCSFRCLAGCLTE